jgi:hypothetical protein
MVKTHQTLGNDILMRSIKILDIGYINVLYVGLAIISAILTDKIMGKFDPEAEDKKSMLVLSLEFAVTVWAYGVIIYVARNLIELVPFPLDGYQGFKHSLVKELGGASVYSFTYFTFSDYMQKKIVHYYKKSVKNTTATV